MRQPWKNIIFHAKPLNITLFEVVTNYSYRTYFNYTSNEWKLP